MKERVSTIGRPRDMGSFLPSPHGFDFTSNSKSSSLTDPAFRLLGKSAENVGIDTGQTYARLPSE